MTAVKTAKRAIKRFTRNLITVSKHLELPYQISFAHGIVTYDKNKHSDIDQLLNDADKVMYQDKCKK